MKKTTGILLALLMVLSLVACGEGVPSSSDTIKNTATTELEKEFSTVDEVVIALTEYYNNPKEQNETVKANASICKYFHEDHVNDRIWEKLYNVTDKDGKRVFSLRQINSLYNICNQTNGYDNWYEYINIATDGHDEPFVMYGSNEMTVQMLTDSIKNKFKDPDSVKIGNAWICFALPAGAQNASDFNVYDKKCRYIILAEVSAKNGFGALDTSIIRIEGSVYWTYSVMDTGTYYSLLTRPRQYDGYGAWSRVF